MNTDEKLITADEVADLLSMSKQWVVDHSNGHRQPTIPNRKIGGKRRYLRSEVAEWADKQRG